MFKNMKLVRKAIIYALITLFIITGFSTIAYGEDAEEEALVTEKYNVDVLVNKNHSYEITNTMTLVFNENRRYFDITIPAERSLIENINLEGVEYFVIEDSDEVTVRISGGEDELNGTYDITLTYNMYEYADEMLNKDLFYMELLPHEWETGVNNTVIGIVFPKDFAYDQIQCFADKFGAAVSSDSIDVKIIKNESKMIITGAELEKGVGISVKADLQQGYWVGEVNKNWTKTYSYYVLMSLMVLLVIMWYLFGRDPEINIKTEYYPPDAMSPPELGYLMEGSINKKDIVSLIFYLADKRHLKIVEYERKKFKIIKNREPKSEKRYIRQAVSAIFGKNDEVIVADISEHLGKAYGRIKRGIDDQFEVNDNRVYTRKSEAAKVFGCFILAAAVSVIGMLGNIYAFREIVYLISFINGIMMFIIAMLATAEYDKWELERNKKQTIKMVTYSLLFVIGVAVVAIYAAMSFNSVLIGITIFLSLCVSMMLICVMKARTKRNAEIMGRVLGFRQFIEKPDLEMILRLSRDNPLYFYDILPYANVFGLTPRWTKSFEIVNVDSPEWFEPYVHFEQRKYSMGINTVYFNKILSDFSRDFTNKISIREEIFD